MRTRTGPPTPSSPRPAGAEVKAEVLAHQGQRSRRAGALCELGLPLSQLRVTAHALKFGAADPDVSHADGARPQGPAPPLQALWLVACLLRGQNSKIKPLTGLEGWFWVRVSALEGSPGSHALSFWGKVAAAQELPALALPGMAHALARLRFSDDSLSQSPATEHRRG